MVDSATMIRENFVASGVPENLVAELTSAYVEAKTRFYRDDLRPSAIEGGRFSEAAFRILEWAAGIAMTPVGQTMPTVDRLLQTLANGQGNESIRLHIPRALRMIYDIRNKRDVAHLNDGIDPNQQDASLVINTMSWVFAEFVRLYHNVDPKRATEIIEDLVSKDAPVVQVFDGFPRILKDVKASDYVLILLYWCGKQGATLEKLLSWVKPPMRANLRRTVRLLDEKNLVHWRENDVILTKLGIRDVEYRKLLSPIEGK